MERGAVIFQIVANQGEATSLIFQGTETLAVEKNLGKSCLTFPPSCCLPNKSSSYHLSARNPPRLPFFLREVKSSIYVLVDKGQECFSAIWGFLLLIIASKSVCVCVCVYTWEREIPQEKRDLEFTLFLPGLFWLPHHAELNQGLP